MVEEWGGRKEDAATSWVNCPLNTEKQRVKERDALPNAETTAELSTAKLSPMASASPISNFFSFLLPSKPPPPKSPQPQFHPPPFSSSSNSSSPPPQSISLSPKKEDWLVPLVGNRDTDYPRDLTAVVCPSLAYSNTLYFRSAYNVQVVVDENEPEERLLNRFRREVMKAGVIQECKRRRFFENKQDERKRKTREAAKRNSRRRRTQFRSPLQSKKEPEKVEKPEDEDDNWEMPEGDLP
ncbi:hypothetical protein Nepgr_016872 [Nepenthes gracilis]|uniref:Ribosomal protein S21 n=1 Tax=Nepenthes gracilis TaxID=150966 RepID=A0AAD3XSS1_NEPGR|nr:hypothetical protein Nepgr_016872 [Nepenthes gracilis]